LAVGCVNCFISSWSCRLDKRVSSWTCVAEDTSGGVPQCSLSKSIPCGNLFSTTATGGTYAGGTYAGGTYDGGTVFQIGETGGSFASTPSMLVSFNVATDGKTPVAGPIADPAGDLFGTTAQGGAHVIGAVFKIATTSTGYASTPATIAEHYGNTDPNTEGLVDDYSAALRWHQSNL
jgi:hypothetical protein